MHSTARPYDETDAARLQPAFGKLITVVRNRLHTTSWTPAWKSPAYTEIAATETLLRADGSAWGKSPASTTLTVIRMHLEATVQHAQAVHGMLDGGEDLPLAIDSETRAALEAAAQVSWLLNPGLTGRERVARLYAHRRDTATKLEDVLNKMGIATAGFGTMPADLDLDYEGGLGLAVTRTPDKKGVMQWRNCEGQAPMRYTERVREYVKEEMGQDPPSGPYAYYCGASHSEGWRILFQYVQEQAPDGTVTFQRRTAAATVNMAVGVCIDALVYSSVRAYSYIGDGAGVAEIRGMFNTLKASATMPPDPGKKLWED